MSLADIPDGSTIFIDANVFIFHFVGHPDFGISCGEFIDRIDRGEVTGVTSAHIMSEVAHRLMTLEAIDAFGWPVAGIAARLRKHPDRVQQLSQFQQAVDALANSPVSIRDVTPELVERAAEVSQQSGLLSNDALIIAIMQENSLTEIASHDADFDMVAGITRYSPP